MMYRDLVSIKMQSLRGPESIPAEMQTFSLVLFSRQVFPVSACPMILFHLVLLET